MVGQELATSRTIDALRRSTLSHTAGIELI
jgi:hypothetical protein